MTLVNARRSLNLQFPLDSFPKFGKMTVAQWPTFAQRSSTGALTDSRQFVVLNEQPSAPISASFSCGLMCVSKRHQITGFGTD